MFDLEAAKDLLNKVFGAWQTELHIYQKMYRYYLGVTDTNSQEYALYGDGLNDNYIMDAPLIGDYSYMNDRANQKISTNYIKKFIKEEVSYSVGNDITYISRSGDDEIVNVIKYNLSHWKEDHDASLTKNMLIYSSAYELYYIDKDAQFCSRIISPRHGIAYVDDYNNLVFFLHIFRQQFDSKTYIDIYTDSEIIHCSENFEEIDRQVHPFGAVPVGIAQVSEEGWLDSTYKDIKNLQDAYEINLSDISQEITEFRNAYLAFKNAQIDENDIPEMKRLGIIQFKGDGSAEFLIKNINDTFIQNTLNTLEDKMYQLTSHINTNEKMQSNTSSLALRARLIGLEEKCKLNNKALANCIKTRLQMLFIYLNEIKNTNYDYKDIKIKFTPNIPSDDLMMAQIISQLNGKLPTETGLAQLSFVDNPKEEMKKLEDENKANMVGDSLLNGGDNSGEGQSNL